MPKVKQTGKMNDKSRSRISDMLISLLATPFNLIFIGLKIIWSGRRLRLAAIALAMIAVAAVVFRVDSFSPLADMLRGETYKATASAGFRVNDITVEGRKRTQRDDLLAAVNIRQNDPIFAVDLPEIHSRIEALGDAPPAALAAIDVITARALAPLPELLGLLQPFCNSSTVALLHKGRNWREELTASEQYWNINHTAHISDTDADARLLEITALRPLSV